MEVLVKLRGGFCRPMGRRPAAGLEIFLRGHEPFLRDENFRLRVDPGAGQPVLAPQQQTALDKVLIASQLASRTCTRRPGLDFRPCCD